MSCKIKKLSVKYKSFEFQEFKTGFVFSPSGIGGDLSRFWLLCLGPLVFLFGNSIIWLRSLLTMSMPDEILFQKGMGVTIYVFITLLKVQNSESTNMKIMKKNLRTKCVWERKFQQNFTKETTPVCINCRFIWKIKGKEIQYMSTK